MLELLLKVRNTVERAFGCDYIMGDWVDCFLVSEPYEYGEPINSANIELCKIGEKL